MLIPLYYGMTIGYTNGLKYLNDTLSTMKPHLIVTVPVILENMIRKFQIPNADSLNKKELLVKRFLGGNMEIIVSGGASLNEEIYSFFEDMGITVCNGYGMTECSPIITCNPIRKTKKDSVGKILNNEDKEIKLVDSEILIRGNIVMDGYLDNDTENKKVFSDGWFHTGDCGSIDSEGYLFITGRKKNLIILSDGNNVGIWKPGPGPTGTARRGRDQAPGHLGGCPADRRRRVGGVRQRQGRVVCQAGAADVGGQLSFPTKLMRISRIAPVRTTHRDATPVRPISPTFSV